MAPVVWDGGEKCGIICLFSDEVLVHDTDAYNLHLGQRKRNQFV